MIKAKKNQLKKKAKKLLGEARKLTKKANELKKKAKKLREKAKKLREKAGNKIPKAQRGLEWYKGEWIEKGNRKEKERVDKRAKNAGGKAEVKKKLDLISQSMYSKKHDELTKKQKSSVKREYKKYKNLRRREIEKILQVKPGLDFIRKNQPVDGAIILAKFKRFDIVELEKSGKIKYSDEDNGWMLS